MPLEKVFCPQVLSLFSLDLGVVTGYQPRGGTSIISELSIFTPNVSYYEVLKRGDVAQLTFVLFARSAFDFLATVLLSVMCPICDQLTKSGD